MAQQAGDAAQLINMLALGDPEKISAVIQQWTTLGKALHQTSTGGGAGSVSGATAQMASWKGSAADEFRTQSGYVSTYGSQLAPLAGDGATLGNGNQSVAESLVTAMNAITQAQAKAIELDTYFVNLARAGTISASITQAANAALQQAAGSLSAVTIPVDASPSLAKIQVTASPGLELDPTGAAAVDSQAVVQIVLGPGAGGASAGSRTVSPNEAYAQYLYINLNEPLRQQAAVALDTLTAKYGDATAQLPSAMPRNTQVPKKWDSSASSPTTVNTPQFAPANMPQNQSGGQVPALNQQNGANANQPQANNQQGAAKGLTANGGPASSGVGANGTGALTSLAGYNPPGATGGTGMLTTPTGLSGLGAGGIGTGGIGTGGIGTMDPFPVGGPLGGTSLAHPSPAAFSPGFLAAGLPGGGGLGVGSDLTGAGLRTGIGTGGGGTGSTGNPEQTSTGIPGESLLSGEEAAATAAGKSGMPPMYPPMMPQGMGQGDRERNRGTYLPEDDLWTEDLDVAPALITGA